METILILEGDKETPFQDEIDCLSRRGFSVSVLDNLYLEPEKLRAITTIKPDCLFVGTADVRAQEKQKLVSVFEKMDYVPTAVMFWGENSVMAYLGLARELKKKGTKFYFAPSPFFDDEEITEIEWI